MGNRYFLVFIFLLISCSAHASSAAVETKTTEKIPPSWSYYRGQWAIAHAGVNGRYTLNLGEANPTVPDEISAKYAEWDLRTMRLHSSDIKTLREVYQESPGWIYTLYDWIPKDTRALPGLWEKLTKLYVDGYIVLPVETGTIPSISKEDCLRWIMQAPESLTEREIVTPEFQLFPVVDVLVPEATAWLSGTIEAGFLRLSYYEKPVVDLKEGATLVVWDELIGGCYVIDKGKGKDTLRYPATYTPLVRIYVEGKPQETFKTWGDVLKSNL